MRCNSCGIRFTEDTDSSQYCAQCLDPRTGKMASKDTVWQYTTKQIAQELSIDQTDALFLTETLLPKLPRWHQA